MGYRVLSEPHRQLLMNARWTAGYVSRQLLSGAREPTPARPVLMRMLWAGEGLVDVMLPIGEDSRVRAAGRARV